MLRRYPGIKTQLSNLAKVDFIQSFNFATLGLQADDFVAYMILLSVSNESVTVYIITLTQIIMTSLRWTLFPVNSPEGST